MSKVQKAWQWFPSSEQKKGHSILLFNRWTDSDRSTISHDMKPLCMKKWISWWKRKPLTVDYHRGIYERRLRCFLNTTHQFRDSPVVKVSPEQICDPVFSCSVSSLFYHPWGSAHNLWAPNSLLPRLSGFRRRIRELEPLVRKRSLWGGGRCLCSPDANLPAYPPSPEGAHWLLNVALCGLHCEDL